MMRAKVKSPQAALANFLYLLTNQIIVLFLRLKHSYNFIQKKVVEKV